MEHYRSVRGIGLAASVLIGLVAIGSILSAVTEWNTYAAVRDYAAGTATLQDLEAADAFTAAVALPSLALYLAAGVVFIVWLWRARHNAERVTYAEEHRRGRGWVIGSWFVPFVNFWFPKQIVDDVWCAGDPAQQDVPLHQRTRSGLVTGWWAAFLAMVFLDNLNSIPFSATPTADDLRMAAITGTVVAVLAVLAAALAVQMIQRISSFQLQTADQGAPSWPVRRDPFDSFS